MALTYLGETSFTQSGPEQWRLGQFELDQMTVPFSGAVTGLDTYISSLTRGDAWSGDANMFLTGWSVSDSNKQYPIVTHEYIGAKGGQLPPPKTDFADQVQSASSSRSSTGTVLSSPLTVEYYAPSTVYTWITATSPGNPTETIPDPVTDIRVITLTCGDQTFSEGGLIDVIVDRFFTRSEVATFDSTELVRDGKFYQNQIRKTKILSPFIFNLPSGPGISVCSPGSGYRVGDILTVHGSSGYATITITSVFCAWGCPSGTGGILSYTTDNITFTEQENCLSAEGGSGSGALLSSFVIP